MAEQIFFFKITLILRLFFLFFGDKNNIFKNPTWCYSGRNSKQDETPKMPVGLIDFCQTCPLGLKMSTVESWLPKKAYYRYMADSFIKGSFRVSKFKSSCLPARSRGLKRSRPVKWVKFRY